MAMVPDPQRCGDLSNRAIHEIGTKQSVPHLCQPLGLYERRRGHTEPLKEGVLQCAFADSGGLPQIAGLKGGKVGSLKIVQADPKRPVSWANRWAWA
jgi:hypothetical protein